MNNITKRILAILIVLLTVGSLGLSAQSQWDIGINVPYYLGLQTAEGSIGEFSEYAFVLPDVKWHYYFGPEILRVGVGVRVWSLIVESALYPSVSLESRVGPVILNASFGGGAFLFFGLFNSFETGAVFLPEISAAVKLGKNFSIGTGALFFIAPDLAGLDEFAYIGTVFARWTIQN